MLPLSLFHMSGNTTWWAWWLLLQHNLLSFSYVWIYRLDYCHWSGGTSLCGCCEIPVCVAYDKLFNQSVSNAIHCWEPLVDFSRFYVNFAMTSSIILAACCSLHHIQSAIDCISLIKVEPKISQSILQYEIDISWKMPLEFYKNFALKLEDYHSKYVHVSLQCWKCDLLIRAALMNLTQFIFVDFQAFIFSLIYSWNCTAFLWILSPSSLVSPHPPCCCWSPAPCSLYFFFFYVNANSFSIIAHNWRTVSSTSSSAAIPTRHIA